MVIPLIVYAEQDAAVLAVGGIAVGIREAAVGQQVGDDVAADVAGDVQLGVLADGNAGDLADRRDRRTPAPDRDRTLIRVTRVAAGGGFAGGRVAVAAEQVAAVDEDGGSDAGFEGFDEERVVFMGRSRVTAGMAGAW